jgi:geranylgeranyl transferase type-2 subunit alpha
MSTEERKAIVDNEFDLVKNAIYTDPEDQSAWLYELWLIGRGMALSVNAHEKVAIFTRHSGLTQPFS